MASHPTPCSTRLRWRGQSGCSDSPSSVRSTYSVCAPAAGPGHATTASGASPSSRIAGPGCSVRPISGSATSCTDAARPEMRIVGAVGDVVQPRARHVRRLQPRLRLLRRQRAGPGGDRRVQRVALRAAIGVGGIGRVARQFRPADRRHQPGEDQVRVAGDAQPLARRRRDRCWSAPRSRSPRPPAAARGRPWRIPAACPPSG